MSAPEHLRCAGCGCEGRRSTIAWDKAAPEAQLPVLTVVFAWGDQERIALLCPSCRSFAHRRKRRVKRLAP